MLAPHMSRGRILMPYVTEENLTDVVRERWTDIPDPRLRRIMTAAIKHLHAFVREVELTEAEWFAAINHRLSTGATPTTVEGPFHVAGAPELDHGGDMAKGAPGIPCYVVGKVRGLDGKPIGGAVLDLWQTDGEGFYEAQRDVT